MSKKAIALFLAFLFYFCTPLLVAVSKEAGVGLEKTQEVMEHIFYNHISSPDADVLAEGAIQGMIDVLGDPYTEYLSPADLSSFIGSLDGEFSGIGVELEVSGLYPVITKVIPGSPAEKAGLCAGDQVVKVDGKSTAGEPLCIVTEWIRGPQDSVVRLEIRRSKEMEVVVEIKRAVISGKSCEWGLMSRNTGYINIRTFGKNTAQEFKIALDELSKAGVKGLILDLRNDPGGYLQTAVDIASFFLPPGKTVVTAIDRDGDRTEYKTSGVDSAMKDALPLVVLINEYSASAAEVLAGALADYQVAKLLGTRSYGKGVVQAMVPLKAGGALKITIARYLTPLGTSIDKNGILPGRTVITPELQLALARQLVSDEETRKIVFALDGSAVFLNEEKISGYFVPLFRENNVYLPLRFTFEALGYEVKWRPFSRDIVISGKGREIFLPLKDSNLHFESGTAFLKAGYFRAFNCDIFCQKDFVLLSVT